ncbi:uncharacterized protein (DUF2236 family) [Diaminobutyricimonas aerilata]|uniref:Uncharacterized protein (DUF2236 family) n=1 Tax=Diaminobutyricimonas aerilata TaxID=1162967 RepID=A0A2M9CMK4_9MICO|nr:oxygenase MpaB family protein [Diaminobutyricimonas aerilata]PJJ73139.1 uncharacterized protein (DUF2236 family) [Diaminobutyricimonas aerilata]
MRADVRQVAGEGILLAGGGCAILLQVADPVVAAGVARHSDFAERPMARLRGTLRYVYSIVFGTTAAADRAARHVDRAHAPVAGARDPHRQLWVAATLYDTAIRIHSRVFGPLDEASADEVYRAYAVLGTALQVPAELWPADRAAFAEYWRATLATLRVGDDARRIARDLLHPRKAPLWLKAAMPLARLVTAGLLPAELRAAYGLPWSARRARRYERAFTVITAVYRGLPRPLREWPMRHYLPRADRA